MRHAAALFPVRTSRGTILPVRAFHEPKSYREADWGRWRDSMSRKSKLKTEQNKLPRRYLDEYRGGADFEDELIQAFEASFDGGACWEGVRSG
jgi:hypothetical protein